MESFFDTVRRRLSKNVSFYKSSETTNNNIEQARL